jgi:hypothetical protein
VNALAYLVLKALVFAVLGFAGAVVWRTRESFLGYLGAGWLGLKLGEWGGAQLGVHDPTEFDIRGQDTPVLFGLAGAIVVMLVVRLFRRRSKRATA